MKRFAPLSAVLLFSLVSGCHHSHRSLPAPVQADHRVSIEVEVYDPVTGFVWVDVGVRIVEAEMEWSGSISSNPKREDWHYTDSYGVAFFDAIDLAAADVGFMINSFGEAILGPHYFEDQAFVLLEIWAPGFDPVFWEVELDWDHPDAFVQIPF